MRALGLCLCMSSFQSQSRCYAPDQTCAGRHADYDLAGSLRHVSKCRLGLQPRARLPKYYDPNPGDLGQRVIYRLPLTQGNNVGIVVQGVPFLLAVLAGLITRHNSPLRQTRSLSFKCSAFAPNASLGKPQKRQLAETYGKVATDGKK